MICQAFSVIVTKLGNLEFNSYDGLIAKSPETVRIRTEGEREESIVLCSICGFQRGDLVLALGWGGGHQPGGIPSANHNLCKVGVFIW